MSANVITVTPDIAARLLNEMGVNRSLASNTVDKYKRDMLAGRWVQESEPIKFDTEGRLIDGQHRLWAVIESGTTQNFIAVRGLPADSFMVLDTGRRRSFKDTISIHRPGLKNLTTLAASTALIARWENGDRGPSMVYSRESRNNYKELWTFFEANEERLVRAVEVGNSIYHHFHGALPGRIWCLFAWIAEGLDAEDAEYFISQLKKPRNLPEDSPIAAILAALNLEIGERRREHRLLFLKLLKAWNAFRRGESMTRVLFRMGGANPETFPEPI